MTRAYEFAKVRSDGASSAGRLLVLSAAALPDPATESRFGIICTKKVGNAVLRNLLRRRIREILRQHGVPLASGYHVVVILRWRAAEADYAHLDKDFRKTLLRLQTQLNAKRTPAPCTA